MTIIMVHELMAVDVHAFFRAVSYPVVEQVLQHYGPDKIYYTLHIFPLWLHRQAFIVAQAAGVVAQNAPQRMSTLASSFPALRSC